MKIIDRRLPCLKLEVVMLITLLACVVATSSYAVCIRFDTKLPNAAPYFDGPGSFGELQDTVTLDCLKYVGSVTKEGKEHVLIKDDRGKVHILKLDSYMGENTGVIIKIDEDAIYIRQLVTQNGKQDEVIVKFSK